MADERTGPGHSSSSGEEVVAREIATEQAHVDRVYAELLKAGRRAELVAVEGLQRGRTDRTGDVRDEEITGLFERDALMFNASRRRHALDRQYEGLVFGRLDLEHEGRHGGDPEREARYVGRLGVRDDEYEPLVIDWRAPAAAPFYRATPVEPYGVIRRRVLRSVGEKVVGLEDDLMVAQAPDDLVVLGEGALLAALGRSRSGRMRDIVATIQAHQDEAIRAPARGVTLITGGPGTGKTVVALHRAAYLLYSDRRRFEGGGILVVGPSAAYTAYIERVLPSLGEESVTLRSVGDVVEAVSASRLDPPAVAQIKGSLSIRRVLARAARDGIPGAPTQLRTFVAGKPIHLTTRDLDRARSQVLRRHQRNAAGPALSQALAEAAWRQVREGEKAEFLEKFDADMDVEAFLRAWARPLDPREVLLWLGDQGRCRRYADGVLSLEQADALSASIRQAVARSAWSVADAALVDDLAARLGPVRAEKVERGFYEIDELDDRLGEVAELGAATSARTGRRLGESTHTAPTGVDALLRPPMEAPGEYAHVLVDEAQDLSPMQWRMIGRRGRWASWTVVGDAAQASWPDAAEALTARDEAFGTLPRRDFHMRTNYRNAREIFEHAARVITPVMPDADIPEAVRETGVDPLDQQVARGDLVEAVRASVEALRDEVDGAIAVVAPAAWRPELADLHEDERGPHSRVTVVDPLSTKGLEYDATVVVDPDEIVAESPGGARVLYVVLTRAAHRMHVLRP